MSPLFYYFKLLILALLTFFSCHVMAMDERKEICETGYFVKGDVSGISVFSPTKGTTFTGDRIRRYYWYWPKSGANNPNYIFTYANGVKNTSGPDLVLPFKQKNLNDSHVMINGVKRRVRAWGQLCQNNLSQDDLSKPYDAYPFYYTDKKGNSIGHLYAFIDLDDYNVPEGGVITQAQLFGSELFDTSYGPIVPLDNGDDCQPIANNDVLGPYSADNAINRVDEEDILRNDDFGCDGESTDPTRRVRVIDNGGIVANYNTAQNQFVFRHDTPGTYNVTYEICDGGDPTECAQAVITVTFVAPAECVPVAVDDNLGTFDTNEQVTRNILTNDDYDCDGPATDGSAVTLGAIPANVTARVDANGNFTFSASEPGTYTVPYEICDATGDCDSAVITFTVEVPEVVCLPVANDDVVGPFPADNVRRDVAEALIVAANDTFGCDGPSTGNNRVLVVNNGDIFAVYNTNRNAFVFGSAVAGTFEVEYRICDASGDCDTAIITVTFEEVPLIDAKDDAYVVDGHIDQASDYEVLSNDVFEGDVPASFTLLENSTNGGFAEVINGVLRYTPPVGYEGSDTVVYEICNADDTCDQATVEFDVQGKDDAPTALDDSYTVINQVATVLDIRSNDNYGINGEGSPAIAIVLPGPGAGSAVINGNGEIVYTANAQLGNTIPYQYPQDSFEYEICDNDASNPDCARATVTIDVDSALKYTIDTSNGSDTVFRLHGLPQSAENFMANNPSGPDLVLDLDITNNGLPSGTDEVRVSWCLYDLDNPGSACVPVEHIRVGQTSPDRVMESVVNLPGVSGTSSGTYELYIPDAVRAQLLALYESDTAAQDLGSKRFGVYAYDPQLYTGFEASDDDEVLGLFLADNGYIPPRGSANDPRNPEGVVDANRVVDTARISNNLSSTEAVRVDHNVWAMSQGRVTPVIPNDTAANPESVVLTNNWRVGAGIHGADHGFRIDSGIRFNPSMERCLRGSRVFFNSLATSATNSAATRIAVLAGDDINCTTLLTNGDYSTTFSATLTSESDELVCPLSTVGLMSGSVDAKIRWTLMSTLNTRLYLQLANVDYDPFDADMPGPINPVFRDLFFTGPLGIPFNLNSFRDQYDRPFAEDDDQAGESVYQGPNTILGNLTAEVTSKAVASVVYENETGLLLSQVSPLEIDLPTETYASKFSGGVSPKENGDEQAGYAMFEVTSDTSAPENGEQVLEVKDLWAQTASKTLVDALISAERAITGQTVGMWLYDYTGDGQ